MHFNSKLVVIVFIICFYTQELRATNSTSKKVVTKHSVLEQFLNILFPINTSFIYNEVIYSHFNDTKKKKESDDDRVVYTAAVIEYTAYDTWDTDQQGNAILLTNARNFISYAQEAKTQGADILVTPEYGLQSFNMDTSNQSSFLSSTQFVPNPEAKEIPCDLPSEAQGVDALRMLSCGARENEIYLAVDMAEFSPCSEESDLPNTYPVEVAENCPSTGYFVYNSMVVFNRGGAVIARYRKQNLFLETDFSSGPPDDSSALFVTDFDVLFSLQICFDIVFAHPGYSNVKNSPLKDVAMSTAWIDELPFDTANGIQNSWSRGLGVNLIVSGHHVPSNNMLGSGIFKGFSGDLPQYVYDRDSGNVLIVSNVTTVRASSMKAPPKNHLRSQKQIEQHNCKENVRNERSTKMSEIAPMIHEDLSNYTKIFLKSSSEAQQERICSNFICCDLNYSYDGNLTYAFMISEERKSLGGGTYFIGMQICGIVWCQEENFATCAVVESGVPQQEDYFGPFELTSSNFVAELMEPFAIHRDLSLISNYDVKFSQVEEINFKMSSDIKLLQPLSVALYGRWYSYDL